MTVDLSNEKLPVRIRAEYPDGSCVSLIAVFQYSGGEILTASTAVLDPSEWSKITIEQIDRTIYAPPWAKELGSSWFRLNSVVPDAHAPTSKVEGEDEAHELAKAKQVSRRLRDLDGPLSVDKVTNDGSTE